jgi:hypothetical protein
MEKTNIVTKVEIARWGSLILRNVDRNLRIQNKKCVGIFVIADL